VAFDIAEQFLQEKKTGEGNKKEKKRKSDPSDLENKCLS